MSSIISICNQISHFKFLYIGLKLSYIGICADHCLWT